MGAIKAAGVIQIHGTITRGVGGAIRAVVTAGVTKGEPVVAGEGNRILATMAAKVLVAGPPETNSSLTTDLRPIT